ncbi:MAG: PA0069 family radical SAM protein [Rhizobiales bacterium]|nr:PA0069 family radical SAM protein [Hyphomicrobiales bacterium]
MHEEQPDDFPSGDGAVIAGPRRRGRGAVSNASGRFESERREQFDDGWQSLAELEPLTTVVKEEKARSVITRNDSPDISFSQSINPYRGCEHGCIYCYARPPHAYLGLSPGLDFETRLTAKVDAPEVLTRELSAKGYRPMTIALGTVTDPYQPVDRERGLTRRILEVLEAAHHPVGIVTKSALVLRDLDILSRMAKRDLVKVAISVTTLDRRTARSMEPRAATPGRRLEAIARLAEAGVPTSVMVAPIVPGLTDHEIEAILEKAAEAGASEAGYVLLRLPLEIATLFREWLTESFPDRAARVIHLMQSMRGGRDYESEWGVRQRGRGPFAEQIGMRFRLACRRFGLNADRRILRTDLFVRPDAPGEAQLRLF